MKIKLAQLVFALDDSSCRLPNEALEYLFESNENSIQISNSESDHEIERKHSVIKINENKIKFLSTLRKISEELPFYKAFLLHSATIDVDGIGVAFAAISGTGKTTHMLLWQKLLGERLKIVNGDKPIVRYFDSEPNTPYAYGTPWNGKERLGCNMRTPLKHICFIERAEQNSCEPIDKSAAINLIFNQVYIPKDPAAAANTIVLINRLLSDCRLWKIKCNMDISAAETAYRAIFCD